MWLTKWPPCCFPLFAGWLLRGSSFFKLIFLSITSWSSFNFHYIFPSTVLPSSPSFSYPSISPFVPHTLYPSLHVCPPAKLKFSLRSWGLKTVLWAGVTFNLAPLNIWYGYLRNFQPFPFSLSHPLDSADVFPIELRLKRGWELEMQHSPLLVKDKKCNATVMCQFDKRPMHTYSGSMERQKWQIAKRF